MKWWSLFKCFKCKRNDEKETLSLSDMENREYEDARRRLKIAMSHGCLNMGAYSEDVDVKLWLPEFNYVNVTVFCDRLLMKNGKLREGLLAITGEVFRYISIQNLEQQSSGFKIIDKIKKENGQEILLLKVSPEDVKNELIIPDKEYIWDGFVWGDEFCHLGDKGDNKEKTTHLVPTSNYEHQFILNFSVSGEFNIDMYFVPRENQKPIWLFSKSFCCK